MKITVNKVEYEIHDYIAAPDLVGLNISQLISYNLKQNILIKENRTSETLQLLINNLGVLTDLAKRIVISPKLKRTKLADIVGFLKNDDFMNSFTNTFEGILEQIPQGTQTPKKD